MLNQAELQRDLLSGRKKKTKKKRQNKKHLQEFFSFFFFFKVSADSNTAKENSLDIIEMHVNSSKSNKN